MAEELPKQYQPTDSKLTTDFNYKPKIQWPNVIVHAILQLLFLGGVYFMFIVSWKSIAWGIKLNLAARFIEFGAILGLAYDLRTAPEEVIKRKMLKSGDGSRTTLGYNVCHGGATVHIGNYTWQPYSDKQSPKSKSDIIGVPDVLGQIDSVVSRVIAYKTLANIMRNLSTSMILYIDDVTETSGSLPGVLVKDIQVCAINIQPVETAFVSIITGGEGWHNYHHTFPMDYRASELGAKYNLSATIIDVLAYLGLAYDLRTAPEYMIKHRSMKYGDGSHPKWGHLTTTETE
ncbi:Desaturase 2 [Carabus blaptoides fortunei]